MAILAVLSGASGYHSFLTSSAALLCRALDPVALLPNTDENIQGSSFAHALVTEPIWDRRQGYRGGKLVKKLEVMVSEAVESSIAEGQTRLIAVSNVQECTCEQT